MKSFGVEVDVKIPHLDFKSGKNFIFNSIFIHFLKLQKNWKPYLECPFQVDFTNDITIEFSCRNNGEVWCWVYVQNPIYLAEKSATNYIFKFNFYRLSKTQINMKPYLESPFQVDLKMVKQLNFHAEIMEKSGVEVAVINQYLDEKAEKIIFLN